MDLTLPNGVDKLTPQQKVVALILAVSVGFGFLMLMPPLAWLLINLWVVAILAIPVIYIAMNPAFVWNTFKNISWMFTKNLIGYDILGYMERYYDWIVQKEKVLTDTQVSMQQSLNTVTKNIENREKAYTANMLAFDNHDKLGNKVAASIAGGKAKADRDYVEALLPRKEEAESRLQLITQLAEVYATNRQTLRYSIDTKTEEFNDLKAMYKGMKSVNDVLDDNNEQSMLYRESLKQLESQMNHMTASIEVFENKLKPVLEGAKYDKQLAEVETMKLLEEFRNTNKMQLTK